MSADKEKLVKRGEERKREKKKRRSEKVVFHSHGEFRFERIAPVGKSRFSLNGEHVGRSGTGERNFAPTERDKCYAVR